MLYINDINLGNCFICLSQSAVPSADTAHGPRGAAALRADLLAVARPDAPRADPGGAEGQRPVLLQGDGPGYPQLAAPIRCVFIGGLANSSLFMLYRPTAGELTRALGAAPTVFHQGEGPVNTIGIDS